MYLIIGMCNTKTAPILQEYDTINKKTFEHLLMFGQNIWLPKSNVHPSPSSKVMVDRKLHCNTFSLVTVVIILVV